MLSDMNGLSYQTTDGFCQFLELCAFDGIRIILHHRVHIWIQIPSKKKKKQTNHCYTFEENEHIYCYITKLTFQFPSWL